MLQCCSLPSCRHLGYFLIFGPAGPLVQWPVQSGDLIRFLSIGALLAGRSSLVPWPFLLTMIDLLGCHLPLPAFHCSLLLYRPGPHICIPGTDPPCEPMLLKKQTRYTSKHDQEPLFLLSYPRYGSRPFNAVGWLSTRDVHPFSKRYVLPPSYNEARS